ncbi:NAD-dependent epimerase/dehydratase family protein [Mesorhizobium sp. M1182]|uniref:NAD-dependent epimerase/dehydratase family protein n=1 Tax=Mesorhizobium sp. M1182 TaxID=2957067 RepID=UPI00333A2848
MQRIWVAGHRGMDGSALARRLSGFPKVRTADSRDLDLTNRAAMTALVRVQRPDLVFMAAKVESWPKNGRPVSFLQNNLTIELSTIAAAFEQRVHAARLVLHLPICGPAYEGKRAKSDVA